jgi:hypothetical protein
MWPAFNSKTGCERLTQARLSIDQGQSKPAKAYLNNHMSMPEAETGAVAVLEGLWQAEIWLRMK